MMKKRVVSSSKTKPVVISESTPETKMGDVKFEVGCRFFVGAKTWMVTESRYEDNTEMRRVQSSTGDDEIRTLKSLVGDSSATGFRFLPDDALSEAMRASAPKRRR